MKKKINMDKINHVKAAFVMAIVLTMIVSSVPVLAQIDETIKTEPMQSRLGDFTEGFENGVVPPADWLNIDYDDDGYLWESYTDRPHSGNYSAASYSWMNGPGILYPDNWLITPAMIASSTSELTYWIAPIQGGFLLDHIEVWISTTNTTVPDDFIEQVDDYTIIHQNYIMRTVDLSSYAGETIYIAFRHCECFDRDLVTIDDITVTDVLRPTGLDIEFVSSDFTVSVNIHNIGGFDAIDVIWNLNITGGILGFINKSLEGNADILPVGDELEIPLPLLIGLGPITIVAKVSATNADEIMETWDGFILFIFIF